MSNAQLKQLLTVRVLLPTVPQFIDHLIAVGADPIIHVGWPYYDNVLASMCHVTQLKVLINMVGKHCSKQAQFK